MEEVVAKNNCDAHQTRRVLTSRDIFYIYKILSLFQVPFLYPLLCLPLILPLILKSPWPALKQKFTHQSWKEKGNNKWLINVLADTATPGSHHVLVTGHSRALSPLLVTLLLPLVFFALYMRVFLQLNTMTRMIRSKLFLYIPFAHIFMNIQILGWRTTAIQDAEQVFPTVVLYSYLTCSVFN